MGNQGKFVKFSGARGVIARNMMGSLHSTAQLTYTTDVDATSLLQVRQSLKDKGRRISYEDIIMMATSDALQCHPEHNGTVSDEGALLREEIHMAFAVAARHGLMVPVVRNLQALSLCDLAAARREMVEKALAGKLTAGDMKDGTFTVSNLGQTRVDHFSPILNDGQIAILGVGRIRGDLNSVGGPLLGLSLTADHRVVDGWASGQFLTDIADRLERINVNCCT